MAQRCSACGYPYNRDYPCKNCGYEPSCFITTAVCEAAGLPDDCRELRTLRQFRDTWMMTTPEGQAKVAEYYAVAPAAVRRIDQRADRSEVYAELRQTFILPSVEFVERGEFAAAEDRYTAMMTHVRSLV